jgi:hypothetical protein
MTMSRKTMNLRVFQGKPIPHVFFQPRFEPWFDWHTQFDSLPPALAGTTLRDVYDSLGASMRTVHYYTGQPSPIKVRYSDRVRITQTREGDLRQRRFETPFGPLFEVEKYTVDRTWRTVEFLAKRPSDLPGLRWLVGERTYHFNAANFETGAAYIGDRGVPQFWVPKSPYLALAQQLMKYEDFIYALADETAIMEEIMGIIDDSYDTLYEELTGSGRLDILNFGENVAMAYLSLDYLERYLLPWYEKRAGQLADAGIYTHIHIDGNFRPLLPYLADMPFDGLEALTPEPQGDVTLEEIKAHIGEKVLLDGIPAVLFLRHHPRAQLEACVERLAALFHPRLVLGISDELPEAGDAESFDRLRWVAEWAQTHP